MLIDYFLSFGGDQLFAHFIWTQFIQLHINHITSNVNYNSNKHWTHTNTIVSIHINITTHYHHHHHSLCQCSNTLWQNLRQWHPPTETSHPTHTRASLVVITQSSMFTNSLRWLILMRNSFKSNASNASFNNTTHYQKFRKKLHFLKNYNININNTKKRTNFGIRNHWIVLSSNIKITL